MVYRVQPPGAVGELQQPVQDRDLALELDAVGEDLVAKLELVETSELYEVISAKPWRPNAAMPGPLDHDGRAVRQSIDLLPAR